MKKDFTMMLGVATMLCTTGFCANVAQAQEAGGGEYVPTRIECVDAVPYDDGMGLEYFYNADYVAQPDGDTYLGFRRGSWYGNDTTITGIAVYTLQSTAVNVTIPDSLSIDGERYPVVAFEYESYFSDALNNTSTSVKSLALPATIKVADFNYYSSWGNVTDLYMMGGIEYVSGSLYNMAINVCNEEDYSMYYSLYANVNDNMVFPCGWGFDWVTVNVEKPGEFAEAYLTQNNHDWSAAVYVKVTGDINDIDLGNMINLASLQKLDLRETAITSLPREFMYDRTSLREVLLPETVTAIGSYAFYDCRNLESVDLGNAKIIGDYAFYRCSSLGYIDLSGITTIGNSAFRICSSLDNIDLSGVASIGSDAFEDCTSLTSIDLTSATSIGGDAFYDCSNLRAVTLCDELSVISDDVFRNTAIETITLPKNLVEISSRAFYNCSSLVDVVFQSGLKRIENEAFYGCSNLAEVSLPGTLSYIGSGAFSNTALKSMKCHAATPPMAGGSFVEGIDLSRTYLYVPAFSKDFYRNTAYWSDFFLMNSLDEQVDYILVDRPLSINLEEEDNDILNNRPVIDLIYNNIESYGATVGELTATGAGTLSAGRFNVNGMLTYRNGYSSYNSYPTLVNYADKMRADSVTNTFTFFGSNRWYFISLPYDVAVSEILPAENTYWTIRRYDSAARAAGETSATWVNLTNDDVMEAYKGYIVSSVYSHDNNSGYPALTFFSGNSTTKNNIFKSTDVIIPLVEYEAEFAHNRSWNLIGNPYPCYFDMHYLNEEFTAPVTIYDGRNYVAYSPVDDNLVLRPYEAFFVQRPLDAESVTFHEAGRMHHTQAGMDIYNYVAAPADPDGRNVFNFNLSDGTAGLDRARIVLNPDATADYEIGRDASKFFGDGGYAQIYVSNDVNYSIDERPVGNGIATLGIRSGSEAAYTLALDGRHSSEWTVLLTDNATGMNVNLSEDDYSFTASAGDDASRFTVEFLRGTSGIDEISSIFGADAHVTVTTVAGITVFTGRLADIDVTAAGIYIISNGDEARKVFLK